MAAMQAAPERSLEQRLGALERANAVRSMRADLKRRVKAGVVPARAVIAEPAPELETMKLADLLLAMPKVGRVKADKLLRRAGVSPSKTLGGLSDRQRAEVLSLVGRR